MKRNRIVAFGLLMLALLLLLPVALTLVYSFFSPEEIQEHMRLRGSFDTQAWMRLLLIPRTVSLGQYIQVLLEDNGILLRFFYSFFYTAATLLGQAVVIPALAYALSAFSFKGRNAIFLVLILLMLLPFQVTMVPNIMILRTMKLLDTVWGLVLPMWFTPFYVFLIRQYMVGIPRELYEAGQLDGAGPVACYWHVALPLCRPVIGAAVALSFADLWNMVEQPLTFLSHRPEIHPLSTVFNQLIAMPTGIEFAGAALYMLPALLVYLFFMEDIVSGIQLTGQK